MGIWQLKEVFSLSVACIVFFRTLEVTCIVLTLIRRVYWADAKLDYIEFCDYDGLNRRTVLSSSSHLQHPFSITLFEDSVYWADWTSNAVLRGNKFSGGNITKLYEPPSRPTDIDVVHPVRQPPGEECCGF